MLVASVVVLNWKDEVATRKCVASVRQLEGIEDCEIIVVDNESTESSRRALSGLGDVRLLTPSRNLGFGGGMNAAINIARGETIALFNNDLVVDPMWLREGLRVLADPIVGIVGGASLAWDGAAPPKRDSKAFAITLVNPERGFAVLGPAPLTEGPTAGVDGSNVLARAHLLQRLGGFDADYFAYYEDIDLCARAWALGYATVFTPTMKVWHRRGASSDRVPRQRAFWAARNQMMTVAKHFPDEIWRRTVFRLVLDNVSSAALGHAGGIRTRNATRLTQDQRVGLAHAAYWTAIHGRALHTKRTTTVEAGQHDEGYVDRLRAMARK